IAAELAAIRREGRGTPVVAIATKTDTVDRQRLAEHLIAVDQLGQWDDIVPVSAVRHEQVDVLTDLLVKHLPAGPVMYPSGELTDEPEAVMVAELIREAALEGVRDELPHSLAVVVDEMTPREGRPEHDPMLEIRVILFVERSSQKGIIIGRGGARLKEVG